ncbi:MAG: hypothetical protein KDE47_28465, partial [Caldilineaceae bacterium]|nr:hypothetical protein [Caldilineaceae bacterium]
MIYKTDQRWQDWVLVWVSFIIVTAIFHEQWLRLLTVGGVLLLRPLYWYLWQRTIDVPGLLAV